MSFCYKQQITSDDMEMCDSEKSLFFNSSSTTTTSSTNDYDLSSTSSFKWASDARLQNKSEWEQIERIFYGEEQMPEDQKTKEEFKEWMTAFPHLRVIGKKITIPVDNNKSKLDLRVIESGIIILTHFFFRS